MRRLWISMLGGGAAWVVIKLGLWVFSGGGDVPVPVALDREPPRAEVLIEGVDARPLRYHPAVGDSFDFTVGLQRSTSADLPAAGSLPSGLTGALGAGGADRGAGPQELVAQAAEFEVRARVTQSSESGFSWQWKVRRASPVAASLGGPLDLADPGPAWAGTVAAVKGRRCEATHDSRGFLHDHSCRGGRSDGPAAANLIGDLDAVLLDLPVHLPEQPVGRGGTWVVHRRRAEAGLETSSRARFDVADLDEEQLVLQASARGSVEGGVWSGLGPLSAVVRGGELRGQGEVTVTLDGSPVGPASARSTARIDSEIGALGMASAASMTLAREVSVRPR